MDWSVFLGPDLIPAATALASFGLMIAAFVGVTRAGGWEQAMRPDPQGRWSLSRRFMLTGALLGVIFALECGILFLLRRWPV
jgi:hypothetical protein